MVGLGIRGCFEAFGEEACGLSVGEISSHAGRCELAANFDRARKENVDGNLIEHFFTRRS